MGALLGWENEVKRICLRCRLLFEPEDKVYFLCNSCKTQIKTNNESYMMEGGRALGGKTRNRGSP